MNWGAVHGSGYLYLLVNTDGRKHYEIQRVDLAAGTSRVITDVPGMFGISRFSVSRAGLVVAEAPGNVSQTARMTSAGTLEPLKPANAAAALISGTGRIAFFVRGSDHVGVAIRRGTSGSTTKPVRIGDEDSALWVNDSALALIGARGNETLWRTVGLDGRVTSTSGRIEGKHWAIGASVSDKGPVPLGSSGSNPDLLWWPATNKTTLVASGWIPECVSPDGKQVIVKKGRQIGVVSTASPRTVTLVGSLGSDVLLFGWVDRSFGPN